MGKAAEGVDLSGEDQKFSCEHVMFEMCIRSLEEGVAYTNLYF